MFSEVIRLRIHYISIFGLSSFDKHQYINPILILFCLISQYSPLR